MFIKSEGLQKINPSNAKEAISGQQMDSFFLATISPVSAALETVIPWNELSEF